MQEFDVCGIGNGVVDILVKVSDEEFSELGFERGSMTLVSRQEQQALLERLEDRNPTLVSGGSVANSVIVAAQIGVRAAHITSLGADRYGDHYQGEFDRLGIRLCAPRLEDEPTGTCLVLITPDAERTMRTHLGASALVGEKHVDEEVVGASRWLFIEGYLFSSPEHGPAAVRRAVAIAKEHGRKVAVTFSALFIVENFREALEQTVKEADLVFANLEEAEEFTGVATADGALDALASGKRFAVVPAGADGAHIEYEDRRFHCPAVPCRPVDLTGAGDAFAGAFLAGLASGVDVEEAARSANHIAMRAITQVGARLQGDVRSWWKAALAPE